MAAVTREMVVTESLLAMLRAGDLKTYVLNPVTSVYLRLGRDYWKEHQQEDNYTLRAVPGAAGWEPAMEGQPILVDAEDLPSWENAADGLASSLIPASAATPPRKRTSRDTPERKMVRKFIEKHALPKEWLTRFSRGEWA